MNIKLNPYVLQWLSSLGYQVYGQPREAVEAMFLREARQWQVSPERLGEMIREGFLAQAGLVWRPLAAQMTALAV